MRRCPLFVLAMLAGSRAHGNDERTPVVGVGKFVQSLFRTVMEVAGP